jgi:hypothetical protein
LDAEAELRRVRGVQGDGEEEGEEYKGYAHAAA